MTRHLQREIERLKKQILYIGAAAEEAVKKSVLALEKVDVKLAESVIEKDLDIDRMEVELEEDCLKVLALYQPVAIDLRFIVSILKINNDLERIGDLAVNIAEVCEGLSKLSKGIPCNIKDMANMSTNMLRESLESLVNMDAAKARTVCSSDADVDEIHRNNYNLAKCEIDKDPSSAERTIMFLSVSRNLERIADHATNIAEDVIYMVEGDIYRHGRRS